MDRSPTAERLFQNWNSRWDAKSAGISSIDSYGRTILSQALVDWADLILVMEPRHANHVLSKFNCKARKIVILDIENRYHRNDPSLIQELREKVPPVLELEERLGSAEHSRGRPALKQNGVAAQDER